MRKLALLLLGSCFVAATASAVPINYGDFTAITVHYRQVTEDALTAGDSTPLFGAPTLAGDALDFNPIGFSANASGIGGTDATDGQLTMMVEAKPTKIVEEIQFYESGEFDLLASFGFEANNAFASVTADITINIIEVDGVGVAPINQVFSMSFTDAGDWLLSTDGSGIPFRAEGLWSGGIDIDITQMLIDEGVPFVNGATKVNVALDNRLQALSAEGTSAFIAKKDFQGLTITAIPEPGTALMLGLGLSIVAARRRATR